MDQPALRPAVPPRAGIRASADHRTHDAEGHAKAGIDTAPLARIAHEVAAEWGLELGEPFALSRFSFVAPAGDDAVLKVVPPEDDESMHEADALAFWGGDGAVRLLRQDPKRRAMLLERARPGHDAAALPNDAVASVAVNVGRRLWRRPSAGVAYQRTHDRVAAWLAAAGADALVRRATALFARLDVRQDGLVHGDLHHHNLLRHGDRWVAIDPKPMLGEAEFDLVTLLWNPIGSRPTREATLRMIATFGAQGFDAERIRAWAVIRGAYLGLPARPGISSSQVAVARMLLE